MKFTLLVILCMTLVGCSHVEKFGEYSIRVNTYDGSDYIERKEDVKLTVNHKKTKVKIKYSDHVRTYDICEYKYYYPKFKKIPRKRDRIGMVLETTDGTIIKINYGDFTTIDIPKTENYDITDTLIWLNTRYYCE
jgi:hypothetical protein